MAQKSTDTLTRAAELLRSGYQADARGLLVDFLKENPNSAKGWWLMSFAVDDLEQQISCVNRILLLQPDHRKAQARLAALKGEFPQTETGVSGEAASIPKKKKLPLSLPAIGLLIVFGCLGILALGYFGYKIFFPAPVVITSQPETAQNPVTIATQTTKPELPATLTHTPAAQPSATQTVSRGPTATPLISSTPTVDPNVTRTPILDSQIGLGSGQYPPDFSLINAVTNAEVNLRAYVGQPVIIVFLGTMSPECEPEMPGLQAVFEKYQDQGLVVLGVGVGASQSALRTYSGRFGGLTFPLMSDWEHDVADLYQIETVPTTFFIRRNGKIWQVSREILTEEELDTAITSVLKVP